MVATIPRISNSAAPMLTAPSSRIARAADVAHLADRWSCTPLAVYQQIASGDLLAWIAGDTWVQPGCTSDDLDWHSLMFTLDDETLVDAAPQLLAA